MAGLTAATVVVPMALAYASIAGLPLQVGLYTTVLALCGYALVGTSRPLSVSTTTTLALMTATQLGNDPSPGVAPTLALLTAGWLALAAVLRLGFLSNFISEPVLIGFKAGIAVTIVVDQTPKLLGLSIQRAPFLSKLEQVLLKVPETSWPTLTMSTAVLVFLILMKRLAPRVPAHLLAVAGSIAVSAAVGLERLGLQLVGAVPTGLPHFTPPDFGLVGALAAPALGMALMSFTESVAAARAFTESSDPRLQTNRELLALSTSNTLSGLFSGMPAGGGTTQTAVNDQAGARSQVSGLVTAVVALAVLLFLGPLIALLPQSTLAAIVVVTSAGLFRVNDFRRLYRARKREFRWALVSVLGVVLLGTLQGILVAVVVSMVSLVAASYDPPVYRLARKPESDVFRPVSAEHPQDETLPGLLIVRSLGMVYFANASRVADKVQALVNEQAPRPQVLVMDGSSIPDLEFTGLKVLGELRASLERAGTEFWLTALHPAVLEGLQRLQPDHHIPLYHNLTAAWKAYQERGALALAKTRGAAENPRSE